MNGSCLAHTDQEGQEEATRHPPPSQTGDGNLAERTQTLVCERLILQMHEYWGYDIVIVFATSFRVQPFRGVCVTSDSKDNLEEKVENGIV